MANPNYLQRFREFLAGIAFDAFLWLSGMTNDEYLTMIYEEAAREIKSEKESAWFMK